MTQVSAAVRRLSRPWLELALGAALGAAALGLTLSQARTTHSPEFRAARPGAPQNQLSARQSQQLVLKQQAEPVASYTMRVKLDPLTHQLNGDARIDWVNSSQVPVSSLFFHLYLNAFKNEETLFLRSPFNPSRGAVRIKDFGYIDVKRLHAREFPDQDLWARRAPHSPGDPQDETDIEVPLPRAILPGERLSLDLVFEARLPNVVERTGHAGTFHFVGQWFPKLARLEADGRFAHFAFHPQAEFYADFGRYDVTIEVPAQYVLGATGERVEQTIRGALRRERYVADSVHDFAWTASDQLVETRSNIGKVQVKVLTPPGYEAVSQRTHEALAWSLPYFEKQFGAYPYRTLTAVHPPSFAGEAGGMEYPTLITTGGSWYAPFTPAQDLDAVIVHELAHQWFYGLLASNEAESPFLDEGLTSYAEDSVLRMRHGAGSLFSGFGMLLAKEYGARVFSAMRAQDEAVGAPAGSFSTFRNLGALVYARTSTLLETAARVWGREKLERALSTYAERFRFAHPNAQDFLSHMDRELGPELRAALETALFARGTLNYVVREVQSARHGLARGFFDKAGQRSQVNRDPDPFAPHRSRVVVYRHGNLVLPVEVLMIAEDGERRIEHWSGHGSYKVFEYTGPTPLRQVVVDPEHKLLIEDSLFDNHESVAEAGLPRLEERLSYFTALLLSGVGP